VALPVAGKPDLWRAELPLPVAQPGTLDLVAEAANNVGLAAFRTAVAAEQRTIPDIPQPPAPRRGGST